MTAVLVSVAEAIKEELKLMTSLVREISPERSYADWDLPLEAMDELFVDVVPVNIGSAELEGRGSTQYTCRSYISVRQKFRPEQRLAGGRIALDEIDDLVELVQQFHDYFIDSGNGRRLSTYSAAAWQETEIRTWYVREHLREYGQFTGIIDLTYNVSVSHD